MSAEWITGVTGASMWGQRTLRLRQPGRLWPAGNASYGSACVAKECGRALLEAFAGGSDWDVDVVVNHLLEVSA
jgi:hypothetical protein